MDYSNGIVNGYHPQNGYDPTKHPDALITPEVVAEILLSWHGLELISCTPLQTLWAGYGHICALTARPKNDISDRIIQALCPKDAHGQFRLILKIITPPPTHHETLEEGHMRKLFSYEIEQFFYKEKAASLPDHVSVAKLIASSNERSHEETSLPPSLRATIITDLRPTFPVAPLARRAVLEPSQIEAALTWMAKFHGNSWEHLPAPLDSFVLPPLEEAEYRRKGGNRINLWLNGGYTYLSTRRKEYDLLTQDLDSEWSAKLCCPIEDLKKTVAELVADFLTPQGRPFETYIHGDVKSENMFFNESGTKVAFYDFQYIGLGLGVCDLAKLFTCSIPATILMTEAEMVEETFPMTDGERALLREYWTTLDELTDQAGVDYPWDLFVRHWEAALVDWCRFQASWGWWGNTHWLMARVKSILMDASWWDWILLQQSDDDDNDNDTTGKDNENSTVNGHGHEHDGTDGHDNDNSNNNNDDDDYVVVN